MLGRSVGDRVAQGIVLPELRADTQPLDEIIVAAGQARRAGRPVRITGIRSRSIEDLMRIAVAGGDCVIFAEPPEEAKPSATTPRRWFARKRA